MLRGTAFCSIPRKLLHKVHPLIHIDYLSSHALDIRMLSTRHVAVLDGAFSFFDTHIVSATSVTPSLLQPIPRFNDIIDTAIDDLARLPAPPSVPHQQDSPSIVFNVGNGLRCSEDISRAAIRRLYDLVLASFMQ